METSQTLGSDYVDMSDASILARLEAEGGELNYDDSFELDGIRNELGDAPV